MISILLPSRGRPRAVQQMAASALLHASDIGTFEVVCRLDEDDPALDGYRDTYVQATTPGLRWHQTGYDRRIGKTGHSYLIGPRLTHSDYWNECARHARGDILMLGADDLRFKTSGWDRIIEDVLNISLTG